ncbi:ABC transporter ATP-binding protein/permease [Stenotrophomonas sp. MMGLT7]|uniref:ABC transporter ATP-binding protein/permease n=1 Tax=Stenotrophomonas sp. MMGLT7 TaxID=2901227 RepID=UPI001E5A53C6|nr:ABC transporter ATP-binding protein/permease [Stenotrophomonas sp. MMGLT7]MCD7099211.1 ABC transporter ATP-binding protein/permease [Stenotrophomonas sp. MMGLT7]
MQIILPYWKSRQSWKGWLLLALQLTLMFGGVYIAVWSNKLDGLVVDAMVGRQWDGLWQVLALALCAGLLAVMVRLLSAYLTSEGLKYQWRSWLTRWYVDAWTQHGTYYGIERDASVDNADQRISQDIEMFVELTLSLTLGTIRVVVTTVTFTAVLWGLSGTLEFDVGGRHFAIPGYMVYLAYAYALGSLLVSHLAGRQLIGLFNRRQTVEADFRYRGMQLRENAEQVAFYDGGERERQRLLSSFDDVRGNWLAIMLRTCKMMLARDMYVEVGSILPTLASLPRYLSGAISLGDVTRITGAFNTLYGSLSFFTQAYVSFTTWRAVGNRLRDLSAAIAHARDMPRGIELERITGQEIATGPITLARPAGESIATLPPLQLGRGERWLIRGNSGAGKSTLLRAVAGIWPYGRGRVSLPASARLMFLPQRSYIPYGSLKAALCYPGEPHAFSDEACREALVAVRLPALAERLGERDRWQQKLSGGEQQRLAIARALLHRPDFLFLDEATSALDPDTEQALYATLLERLPGSTLVSVAHRRELEAFHDRVFELEGTGAAAAAPA